MVWFTLVSSGAFDACLMVTLRTPPEGTVLFLHEILTDSEARFGWLLALAQLADTSALTIRSFPAQADFSFPHSTTFFVAAWDTAVVSAVWCCIHAPPASA